MPLFESFTLESGIPGPRVLVTGGVHGDEFEPMAAIRQLHSRLAGRLQRGRLTLIPVVNVSAFQRGQRTGADGLDLARTCPGRADGSLTEQVAAELSAAIRQADWYIDLHTGGTRLQVLPLAGYVLHPDPQVLEKSRRMARLFNLPLIWGTDPSLNGRSLSVARDAGIPAIYAEYLGGSELHADGVEAYVSGCLNIFADLGLVDREISPLGNPRIVEDDRPGAGHMQINHPTPCEGFFTPAVQLGQQVSRGDLLGTVCNELGTQSHEIRARYAGTVIVLHTFARIDNNVSVVVILE